VEHRSAGGLKIRDTADWKSALRDRTGSLRLISIFLVFVLISVSSFAQTVANSYSRIITNDLPETPLVTVAITNALNIFCFTVEERLPAPLQAVNITCGGVWNLDTGTVRWGPFSNAPAFSANYRVTGPPGTYPVDGSESVDGQWTFDPRPTLVTIAPPPLAVAVPPPAAPSQTAMPIFSPPSGTPPPVVVTMVNLDPNAITYFTLDGTPPDTNSTRYTGPVTITNDTVLRARAFVTGQSPSAAATAYYYTNSPMSVPPTNSCSRIITNDLPGTPLVTVLITNALNIFCFTVEERLPGPLQAVNITGGGVWNPDTGTVRWGPFSNAPVFSATYRVTGPPGAYSVDGSESVDGQWTFDPGPTLVTIASPPLAGVVPPPAAPSQVAMPAFEPPSGAGVPTNVSLSCATTNAVVRITYTLDGSMPTPTNTDYTAPLHFDSNVVVRARAFADGWIPSAVSVAYYGPVLPPPDLLVAYAVDTNAPSAPWVSLTASPGPTAHCFAVEEWLSAGLSASNITDGGVFNASNAVVRWGPFFTTNTQTLAYQAVGLAGTYPVRAIWSVDGVSSGETQAITIVLAPAVTNIIPTPPSQEPPPILSSTNSGALVMVTISDSDAQAELYYTTNGSSSTPTWTLYTTALVFTQPTTLQARAFGAGSLPSAQAVAYYGLSVPPPDFQVSCTVNTNSPLTPVVNLTATPGPGLSGVVCYAVEESLPAGVVAANVTAGGVFIASNAVVRWGPFFGTTPMELSYQAIGLPGTYPLRATWSVNGVSNGESQGSYLVIGANPIPIGPVPTAPSQEPAPVLSPAIGTTLPITVAISCSDPQAQIRYTLDGSSPSSGSLLYTGALTLASPATLRARSFRSGWLPSAAAVGYYSIAPANTNSLALVRSVSNDTTSLPAISITATPRNIQCYAVTETLASGLTPSQIGQNAVWDATNRVLKWGPYTDAQPRVLTYKVTGPSTTYPLAGQGSFDGSPAAITGATVVRVDQSTVIYVGNTNDGFGGAIGNGSLILSDDGTNLYGTLITSGPMDNALVLYIAPSPDGFSSTTNFHDAAKPLRTAISGYTATQNNGGPGQSVLTFEPGFTPSYAIALQPGNGVNFGGLWGLANGGNNSLPFITSVNLTPVGTDVAGTYRFSLNVTNIGLTPGAGQSFELFGTFVSDTGFRSTEAVAGDLTGIQGWNPFTQTAFATYTMVPAIFPLIVAPPADQTVHFGQSAQFASTAIGTGPLTFQWQFNGSNLTDNARISGSQSSTLTIAGAQLSDAGTYLLVVTNVFSATSAGAVLTVLVPPLITTQPTNQTVLPGSSATFTVTATGTAPLSYKWYFNSTVLTNATNATLALNNVQTTNAGIYYAVVSNAAGSVTSSYVALRVFAPSSVVSSVVAWGDNTYGQTNVPPNLTNVVAIAVSGIDEDNLALKNDGTVVAWGLDCFGQLNVPSTLTNVVAIAAGQIYNLALKGDGEVFGWGWDGGAMDVPSGLTNVVAIAAGGYHNLALKNDGTVVAWGFNYFGMTNVPTGLTNVVAIAAGGYHSLALKNNGTVVAWGGDTNTSSLPTCGQWNYGQSIVPTGLTNVVAIAGGAFFSLALKSDGTVVAWGDNECGQTNVPSGLTNVVAIAGGGDHSLALKADGAVVAWGAGTTNSGSEPNVGQSIVPAGLTNVVAIGGGNDCSLALVNLPPMNAPPVITTQPTGCTNVVGTTATFLSNPHFSEAGQFTFSVGGDPNAVFDILVSTNLAVADWSLLSTFTNITGNDTITLPVVNDSAAFYRLRSH
jgi:hypothetical protein